MNSKKYSLRPQARPVGDSTLEGGYRVFMSPSDMNAEGLAQGDYIKIQSESTNNAGVAVVSRAPDNIGGGGGGHKSQGNPVIRISEWLRGYLQFELKDRYYVTKWDGQLKHVIAVTLTNVTTEDRGLNVPTEPAQLEWCTAHALFSLDCIAPTGTFEVTLREGNKKRKRQRFLVEKIEPIPVEPGMLVPFTFDHRSKITFRDGNSVVETTTNTHHSHVEFGFDSLKGMTSQLRDLTYIINKGLNLAPQTGVPAYRATTTKPVLIQGITGCGKTEVIKCLASARGCKIFHVDGTILSSIASKTEANLNRLFEDAIAGEPSLVLIDDIHFMAGKEDSAYLARSLAHHIVSARNHRVQIVATARDLADIHDQISSRFVKVIDLPIPDLKARCEILAAYAGGKSQEAILELVAERTHAFVAEDLQKLWLEALESAEKRLANRVSASSTQSDDTIVSQSTAGLLDSLDHKVKVSSHDFEEALQLVHASAMNAVYVEVPKVKWSDIGGSEQAKKHLQQVTKYQTPAGRERLLHFDVLPTKGVLLYGPPGCSKTLLAKAFATESGLNFLAVKGPELISKFVGDTEHNIREIFRKARAAAPSVIFFDEFDAMARRDTGHDSLSPVTALLTEMDGIEGLSGVFVMAATNRPQVIDKALIRPGRIDSVMFVGPPNIDARLQILLINTKNKPLDPSVNLESLAKATEGYSGAEVAEICRVAAFEAAEDYDMQTINMAHFEHALDKATKGIPPEMLVELQNWSVAGAKQLSG